VVNAVDGADERDGHAVDIDGGIQFRFGEALDDVPARHGLAGLNDGETLESVFDELELDQRGSRRVRAEQAMGLVGECLQKEVFDLV
jgi:hypothetical protein